MSFAVSFLSAQACLSADRADSAPPALRAKIQSVKLVIKNLAELKRLAEELLTLLRPVPAGATILGLYGELGSGKTTFTQALAQVLGVKDRVASPTFVLQKSYQLPVCLAGKRATSLFKKLVHLDCYRLEKPEELLSLGWLRLVSDPSNFIVVEWADRVESLLPAAQPRLFFKHLDETSREVELKLEWPKKRK